MTQTPGLPRARRRLGFRRAPLALGGMGLSGALLLSGCAAGQDVVSASPSTPSAGTSASGTAESPAAASAVFDASTVHTFSIEVDPDALEAMLSTYASTQEKEWIEATVTIDGQTFERVGIRLKGNSSLRNVNADTDPSSLPLLIRLDKYVDDQDLEGYTEFIVRSNSTATSINEAVSLDLLRAARLASEQAVAAEFSVNGSAATLRLVVQNLDETWQESSFDTDGILYKAEADGDYSYRGTDPASYADVFDQETGEDNLTPLIDFLDFVNNSTDEEFAAELVQHLDVEAFATYLAFEDLVDNFYDIDGPGNNSFLYWDAGSGQFTVVAWDHNLTFGARNVGGGGGGGGGGGDGAARPAPQASGAAGQDRPAPGGQAQGGGRGGSRSNPLVERFLAVDEFAALKAAATELLQQELVDSGVAAESLAAWVDVLKGSGLVDDTTIEDEAAAIRDRLAELA